jgi:hypothetical protein
MEGLTTNQKGAIAEAEVARAAAWAGYPIYKPLADHCRADLVLEIDGKLLRVQCKWGTFDNGVIRARLGTSRHSPTRGYVRTTYESHEIDAIGIFCAQVSKCYLLPISLVAGQTYLHLRVDPSRNNQRVGLKWARDYELSGAIAQLGER